MGNPEVISKFVMDDTRQGIIIPMGGHVIVVFERYKIHKNEDFVLVAEVEPYGSYGITFDFIKALFSGNIENSNKVLNALSYICFNRDY